MTVRKKMDATLFELCLGIFLYGVIFECILLCFSRNASYSIGFWCGVITAIAGSIHMWVTLDRSMELVQKSATVKVTTNYIVRYLLLAAVIGVLAVTGIGNPIFAFLGYMGMKLSAYLNPQIKKLNVRFFKVGI